MKLGKNKSNKIKSNDKSRTRGGCDDGSGCSKGFCIAVLLLRIDQQWKHFCPWFCTYWRMPSGSGGGSHIRGSSNSGNMSRSKIKMVVVRYDELDEKYCIYLNKHAI